MTAINFTVFIDKILSGEKKQTIRKVRKIPIKVGDDLQLYTGMRTASCRLLGESVCLKTESITINRFTVRVAGNKLPINEYQSLANADGFSSYADMLHFFQKKYGVPFDGEIIHWDYLKITGQDNDATS